MPEDAPAPRDEAEIASENPPESGGGSMLGKLKVVIFVLVVIVAECIIAYMWLPSASETAAWAGAAVEENVDAKEAAEEQRQREEEAVDLVDGRILVEVSGGITPEKAAKIAEAGVDLLSIGWLTHSAPSLDVALELDL